MVLKRNKRAAFEMSVSTMIIIVLAVVFLILALTLIRNIFGSATQSVDVVNDQVMSQLRALFTDENQKIVIKLSDNTADIRADNTPIGIAVAARTLYGNSPGNYSGIQYKLEPVKTSDCYTKLGITQITRWFTSQKLSTTGEVYNDMDKFDSVDLAGASIKVQIPEGTISCSQQVRITFIDNTQEQKGLPIGGDTLTIQVMRKALF